MKHLFSIFFVLFCLGCNTRYIYLRKGNYNCEALKKEFISSNFMCSKETIIPKKVLKILSEEFHDDYTLAKYDEVYNDTDLRVFPNKRIIINGINQKSKIGFLVYEKGGLGINNYIVIYKMIGRKAYVTTFLIKEKYSTVELLKKHINEYICI